MNLLEVQDITSGYEGVQILWGVNLRLEQGKLTTLRSPFRTPRPS